MPKGVKPDVLSFWGPDENGVVQNDFFCIGRTAKNPALAHRFINFMLDEKNAYDNFVNFIGYTPPQKTIDAELLIKQGLIPKSLTQAVVRPDQFAFNQELLQLSVDGRAALGRRLVEVQGRVDRCMVPLDVAPARAPRRRLAVDLLPASRSTRSSRSRSATRTRSREPVPFWNPLDWNVGYVLDTLREHLARRASSSPSSCARSRSSRSRSRSRC